MASRIRKDERVLTGKVQHVDPKTLKPHPENPNKGKIEEIQGGIKEVGFYGALVVQRRDGKEDRILVGEHRWKAAIEEGLRTVPILPVTVDDETAKKIMLADNRLGEMGVRDREKLAKTLGELMAGRGIAGTGYSEQEAKRLMDAVKRRGKQLEEASDEKPWRFIRVQLPPGVHEQWMEWVAHFREEGEPTWKAVERMMARLCDDVKKE